MLRSNRDSGGSSLRILMLVRSFGFPDGMAASRRVKLLGQALAQSGAQVDVLCTQANEPVGSRLNTDACGRVGSLNYEYVTGRTRRSDSFVLRRLIDVRGFLVLSRRVAAAKIAGEPIVAYLWISPREKTLYRRLVLGLLMVVRVPCVMELNEPPWSYKDSRISRWSSPLWGVKGVVAISFGLCSWAQSQFAALQRSGSVLRVPVVADMSLHQPVDISPGQRSSVLLACSLGYRGLIEFVLQVMACVWEDLDCDLRMTGFDIESESAGWLRAHPILVQYSDRIRTLGFVSEAQLVAEYARSGALLAPIALEERSDLRFPSKIAEYLISGRPVVTSRIGDVGRYLTDGVTAFVAEPDDVDGFAERVRTALAFPDRAREIGEAGFELASTEFEVAQHAEGLMRMLRAVADGRQFSQDDRGLGHGDDAAS